MQGKTYTPDASPFVKLPVIRTADSHAGEADVRRKVLFMSKNKNNYSNKNNSGSQNKNSDNSVSDKNSNSNYQDKNSDSNSSN